MQRIGNAGQVCRQGGARKAAGGQVQCRRRQAQVGAAAVVWDLLQRAGERADQLLRPRRRRGDEVAAHGRHVRVRRVPELVLAAGPAHDHRARRPQRRQQLRLHSSEGQQPRRQRASVHRHQRQLGHALPTQRAHAVAAHGYLRQRQQGASRGSRSVSGASARSSFRPGRRGSANRVTCSSGWCR